MNAQRLADRKKERGVILLLTLFIVTLLTILVLEFNYTTRVEYHISSGYRDELLALNAANAGVFQAIALLRQNRLKDIEEKEEENGKESEAEEKQKEQEKAKKEQKKDQAGAIEEVDYPDHYGEEWALESYMEPFGEGFLSVKVIDESGKININRLVKEEIDVAARAKAEAEKKKKEEEKKDQDKDKEAEEEEEEEKLIRPRKWGQKDKEVTGEEGKEKKEEEEEEEEYEEPARYVVDKDVKKIIIRLIEDLDIRKVEPEEVADAIVDWMDSNDEGDWEDEEYGKKENSSPPKNAPLDVLSELLMINGVTGDLYYGEKQPEGIDLETLLSEKAKKKKGGVGLRDCLTIYSNTRVNVNTAPPEVLAALLEEENESLIKEITSYTRKDYFKDLKHFEEEIGEHIPASFMAKVGVGSDSFQIISEGQVNNVKKQVRVFVQLDKDADVRILYWRVEG